MIKKTAVYNYSLIVVGVLVFAFGLATSLCNADIDTERIVVKVPKIDKSQIAPKGEWRKATVPDTIDLAERAEWALNYMFNNVVPDKSYSLYHVFQFDQDPPVASQLTWNLPVKVIRAYPWVRTMTGSNEKLDVEINSMLAYLNQIDERGVVQYPYGGEGVPEGTSYAYTQGMLAIALDNWYRRDGNEEWLKLISTICRGVDLMAIRVEDRAYFPLESGYKSDGTWHWTTRAGATPFMEYNPPEEPVFEQQGYEGIAKYDQSSSMRALLKDYQFNGNEGSLELAHKIVRFMMKPGLWKDTTESGLAGNEHGVWQGHFHGNLTALHGLMEYGVAADSEYIKKVVKNAYEYTTNNTIMKMGWSPFWVPPGGFNRPAYLSGWCDTCNVADTIVLAVKLIDAGLGDYWDDVEYLVRNQLAEQQITDLDLMQELSGCNGACDAELKKYYGGFGGLEPTRAKPLVYGCCSANGPMGLYYAWHGITRFDKDVATVNMFLNRSAKWLDIDSYLPYEGKVVIHNKKASTIMVRIPGWLDQDKVRAFVNGKPYRPAASGNKLVFSDLKRKAKITLEFPVEDDVEKHTIFGTEYKVTYRGPTVVDISPRVAPPISQNIESYKKMYPVYLRDHLKATKAPMKKVKRFISDELVPLQ